MEEANAGQKGRRKGQKGPRRATAEGRRTEKDAVDTAVETAADRQKRRGRTANEVSHTTMYSLYRVFRLKLGSKTKVRKLCKIAIKFLSCMSAEVCVTKHTLTYAMTCIAK